MLGRSALLGAATKSEPPLLPGNIATAQWFDAADSTTVIQSDNLVEQWRDKSGNNKHAVQLTSAKKPTYLANTLNGLPVIRADGVDDEFAIENIAFYNQSNFAVFAVMARDEAGIGLLIGTRNFGGIGSNVTGFEIAFFDGSYVGFGINSNSIGVLNGGTDQNSIRTTPTNSFVGNNTPRLLEVQWTLGSVPSIWLEGTSQALTNWTGSSVNNNIIWQDTTAGMFDGFNSYSGNSFMKGYIAEFIVINQTVSDGNRQIIEGYLAHKWGLTGSLPAVHPYKTTSP